MAVWPPRAWPESSGSRSSFIMTSDQEMSWNWKCHNSFNCLLWWQCSLTYRHTMSLSEHPEQQEGSFQPQRRFPLCSGLKVLKAWLLLRKNESSTRGHMAKKSCRHLKLGPCRQTCMTFAVKKWSRDTEAVSLRSIILKDSLTMTTKLAECLGIPQKWPQWDDRNTVMKQEATGFSFWMWQKASLKCSSSWYLLPT